MNALNGEATGETIDKFLIFRNFMTEYEASTGENLDLSLSMEEMFMLSFKDKLDKLGIDYEEEELMETYYYKAFISAVGEDIAYARYIDYSKGFYDIEYDNVDETIAIFNTNLDAYNNGEYANIYESVSNSLFTVGYGSVQKLAQDKISYALASLIGSLKYNSDTYTSEEKAKLQEIIINNIDFLEEEDITKYGLQNFVNNAKELKAQEITANYSEDLFETN